jgi:hypothetical protein
VAALLAFMRQLNPLVVRNWQRLPLVELRQFLERLQSGCYYLDTVIPKALAI